MSSSAVDQAARIGASAAGAALRRTLRESYPEGLEVSDLMDAVVLCMRHLRMQRELTGAQKQALLIRALTQFCTEATPDSMDRLDPVIREVVPVSMNYIIQAEKGQLKLRRALRRCCC